MYLTRLFLSITSDRGFKNISPVEFQFFFPFIMFTLANIINGKKDDYMDIHVSVPTKIGKVGKNNCYNLIC